MTRMNDLYKNTVRKNLKSQFGYKNDNEIPKVTKVVVNAGVGKAATDSKYLEEAIKAVTKITGQAPVVTKAHKSVAGFKIREGMKIGTMVTLRSERMYEFLDRLVSITLPRVRDFRGIKPSAFDGHGNYSLGIREHGVFPEISFEEAAQVVSLQINIQTTAKTDEEALGLLKGLGFPFKD